MKIDHVTKAAFRVSVEQRENIAILVYTPKGVITIGIEPSWTYGARVNLSPIPTGAKINVDHFAAFYSVPGVEGDEQRPWSSGFWEVANGPLPSVESCQRERAEVSGGCGACALCCKEWREKVESLECSLAIQSETTDKYHAMRIEAENQARHAWERHAEKDAAYGEAIRERDNARDHEAAIAESLNHASDLAMTLASRLAIAHGAAHGGDELDGCQDCGALRAAREWAK